MFHFEIFHSVWQTLQSYYFYSLNIFRLHCYLLWWKLRHNHPLICFDAGWLNRYPYVHQPASVVHTAASFHFVRPGPAHISRTPIARPPGCNVDHEWLYSYLPKEWSNSRPPTVKKNNSVSWSHISKLDSGTEVASGGVLFRARHISTNKIRARLGWAGTRNRRHVRHQKLADSRKEAVACCLVMPRKGWNEIFICGCF